MVPKGTIFAELAVSVDCMAAYMQPLANAWIDRQDRCPSNLKEKIFFLAQKLGLKAQKQLSQAQTLSQAQISAGIMSLAQSLSLAQIFSKKKRLKFCKKKCTKPGWGVGGITHSGHPTVLQFASVTNLNAPWVNGTLRTPPLRSKATAGCAAWGTTHGEWKGCHSHGGR